MPKTKAQKIAVVEGLMAKAKVAESMFILSTKGINPNEASELKIQLAELGAEYHLIKNSLFKLAVKQAELPESSYIAGGQNAIVFSQGNSTEVAKVLQKFIKTTQKAEFKGGYLDKKQMDSADVVLLATLPGKDQLIAQVLATINAPITGFVRVLAGNISGLLTVIDAYQQQKTA